MKKALFIPLGFYDYDKCIEDEIIRNGYTVDVFNPIQDYNFFRKVINTASKGSYLKKIARERQKKYFQNNQTRYDLIFVIVGRFLEEDIFASFCEKNPEAKKVLYLWDDVARIGNFQQMNHLFESIYSFDKKDVDAYGFHFLPLFYTDKHRYDGCEKNIGLSLMGMLHSERIEVMSEVQKQGKIRDEDCFVYLLGAKLSHFVSWINPWRKKWMGFRYIHIKGMPFETCAEIMKKSKVTLDVQFGTQNGLTLRTFEALASKTKMITTNASVAEYDFYHPSNICIVDRKNPEVEESFFTTPYYELEQEMIEKYSLQSWINQMINE